MKREPFSRRAPLGRRTNRPRAARPWAVLAVLAGGFVAGPAAFAQAPDLPRPAGQEVLPAYAQSIINGTDAGVVQAGCASCGGGSPVPSILPPGGGGGGGACACSDDSCASCQCKPGRSRNCFCGGCSDGACGRFFGGLTECLCCPDPCYEPVWVNTANAAFFQDTVRPRNTTRFRWDSGVNVVLPERAEFFWAKPGELGGKGPRRIENRVDYDELSLYQEIAAGKFAFFIETPYRAVDPDLNPHHANFGDLNLGTKSLLIDCELLQLAFQFRTFIPTGGAGNGIGTGHTSLEPSFLAALKLSQDTYLQAQLAEWIEGSILHYHFSLNHSWFKRGPFQLIGTSEFNGWTFQDGAFADRALAVRDAMGNLVVTNQNLFTHRASGESYITLGGGFRLVYCENFDIGFGTAFAITDDHWADQLYRTEVRFRY
jgi:hypothetical protein